MRNRFVAYISVNIEKITFPSGHIIVSKHFILRLNVLCLTLIISYYLSTNVMMTLFTLFHPLPPTALHACVYDEHNMHVYMTNIMFISLSVGLSSLDLHSSLYGVDVAIDARYQSYVGFYEEL